MFEGPLAFIKGNTMRIRIQNKAAFTRDEVTKLLRLISGEPVKRKGGNIEFPMQWSGLFVTISGEYIEMYEPGTENEHDKFIFTFDK